MRSVICSFSPNDTLLIGAGTVVRIVEYDEGSVTAEIVQHQTIPFRVTIFSCWVPVVLGLEAKYRGIVINHKCDPPRRAAIHLRGIDLVDVRRHSFGGVPVSGCPRF